MQPLSEGVLVMVLTSTSALSEGVLVRPTAGASTSTPRQSDGELVMVLDVASTSASPQSEGEPVAVLVVASTPMSPQWEVGGGAGCGVNVDVTSV